MQTDTLSRGALTSHSLRRRAHIRPLPLPPSSSLPPNKLTFHFDAPISRNSLSTLCRPLISRNIVLRAFLRARTRARPAYSPPPQKSGTVISSDVLALFNICELRSVITHTRTTRGVTTDHPELALLYSTEFFFFYCFFALDVNYVVYSSKVRPDDFRRVFRESQRFIA